MMILASIVRSFEKYCVLNEIKNEVDVPKAPKQNNISYYMNITIIEHARSIRFHVDLTKQFWVDIVNTEYYCLFD